MAHHRDIVPTMTDRENIHAKPEKAQLTKKISHTRRPPLGDLGPEPVQTVKLEPQQPAIKSFSTSQSSTAVEQDPETCNDPRTILDLDDIFPYLFELETKYPVREDFLKDHMLSPQMRALTVDWLVKFQTKFGLHLQTLHMCVSLIDRYLQENSTIGKGNVQLVGISALLIACKHEEVFYPGLENFEYESAGTCSPVDILKMERYILITLEHNVVTLLSIDFLKGFHALKEMGFNEYNLSKYMLELALLDCTMSHIKPSLQAAAAYCLSITILKNSCCPCLTWTGRLAHYNCRYSDFIHVIVKFAKLLISEKTLVHKSIQKKYAESKYNKISMHPIIHGHLIKQFAEGDFY